jgi:hypothetical protein
MRMCVCAPLAYTHSLTHSLTHSYPHAFAEPEAFEAVMADLDRVVLPGVTHWQSPHFFAYFPCNASFPAMLGDMVSGMINCVGFNWVQTDRQTDRQIDRQTERWRVCVVCVCVRERAEGHAGRHASTSTGHTHREREICCVCVSVRVCMRERERERRGGCVARQEWCARIASVCLHSSRNATLLFLSLPLRSLEHPSPPPPLSHPLIHTCMHVWIDLQPGVHRA